MRTRPAPSAPAADGRAGVGHRAEVGGDHDVRAVARDGGLAGAAEVRGARARASSARGARYSASSRGVGSTCSSPVAPSTTSVVPSGTASTSRPAATTSGMPRDRARIAACERRAPGGQHDAPHQREVEAGGLGRGQVAGDEDARRPRLLAPTRRRARGVPARPRRGRRRPARAGRGRAARTTAARRRPGSRSRPRPRRRPASIRRLDVGEHLGVGEQREVGVEDAGLVGADLAGGEGAQVLDVAAYLGDGLDDPSPLGRRRRRRPSSTDRSAAVQPCAPGRSRCPATRRAAPAAATARRPGRRSSASASSKRRAASASRCSTASCACGPEARTSTSWPCRAPSVATRLRLAGRHRPGAGGQVAQRDRGVETAHLADQPRSRPGVQAVRVSTVKTADDVVAPRRRRRGVAAMSSGADRWAALPSSASRASAATSLAAGSAGGGDGGDDEPSTSGAGESSDPLAGRRVVEQVEGELGAEHRAAQVHEHDDAGRAVDLLDGLLDLRRRPCRTWSRRARRRPRCADRAAVQHLRGQRDRGPGQRPAVRDDDDADGRAPPAHRPSSLGRQADAALVDGDRAATSSATLVAPGSWWPTLRSPR